MPRPPPAKRKLIDLVQEERKDDHDGDTGAAEDGGAEADYMSDALLPTASSSSSSSNKRRVIDEQQPRARLDERHTRAQGLSRPVGQQLPLALRMMQAMGYEEGQALGAQKEGDDDDAGDGDGDDDGKAQGRRDGPLLAPVRPDLTRSSEDQAKRRAGIGALVSSKIADAANASLDPLSTDDFRSRAAAQAADARAGKTLSEAKRVCRDLDMRVGVEYLPLWLMAEWFMRREGELGSEEGKLVQIALEEDSEEEEQTEGQEKEEKTTLQDGDVDVNGEQNGQGDKDKDDTATRPSPPRPLSRRREARAFLSLPPTTQLTLILTHLRSFHHFCLFCGTSYDSEEDMAANCPGEDEDAH